MAQVVLFKEKSMLQAIQSTDLRRRSREILERVRLKKEALVIQNYGTPQAVIIPYEDYAEFLTWRASKEKRAIWLAELQHIAAAVTDGAALSEEKAGYIVDEATQSMRGK
jgi:prevent-host-death family protein